ncbi:unnamed protein product [Camellia sinensis]
MASFGPTLNLFRRRQSLTFALHSVFTSANLEVDAYCLNVLAFVYVCACWISPHVRGDLLSLLLM